MTSQSTLFPQQYVIPQFDRLHKTSQTRASLSQSRQPPSHKQRENHLTSHPTLRYNPSTSKLHPNDSRSFFPAQITPTPLPRPRTRKTIIPPLSPLQSPPPPTIINVPPSHKTTPKPFSLDPPGSKCQCSEPHLCPRSTSSIRRPNISTLFTRGGSAMKRKEKKKKHEKSHSRDPGLGHS